jgi:hypothetical protein
MFRSQLKGGIVLAAALVGSLGSAVANADEDVSSANYMLPLCKTWLKVNVEHDRDEIKHILTTDPVQFTSSGMCAGFVIGVTETLRVAKVSCPPDGITNDQLVRMVVDQIEKYPERLHEDFIVPVTAVMIATWSCKPTK